MKSDRELLEFAAKAYGDESVLKSPFGFDRVIGYSDVMQCDVIVQWDPLNDDGDALRLAVELGLVVCVMRNAGFTGVYLPACSIGGKYDEVQHHGNNANAATRRAIVSAAATIGENMK